jgi:hypothetical protein
MEIDSQALTTCDVAPDGETISLGFIDTTRVAHASAARSDATAKPAGFSGRLF